MRVILCSGKGGVGKTSCAAATAVQSAEFGHRTIAFSTDSAHSLGDSFNMNVGPDPTRIADKLWAQETTLSHIMQKQWQTIRKWLSALLAWRGIEGIVAEDMAILPGMEELANLLYIVNYAANRDYDVIIVDCAPTGETLRLLSFPEILHWWVDKVFPIGRTAATLVKPFAKPARIPVPDKEVFDSAQRLFDELTRMHQLLTNPAVCSTRIVVNPEKMVLREARRLFTYLNLYGYFTDLVICNRLIPDEVQDSYFDSWKETQTSYLKVIRESFTPIPVFTVPMFSQEVVGIPMLRTMAQAIYGEKDPTAFFFRGHAQKFVKRDGSYILKIDLPFASKEDISVTRVMDELVIQVGAFKRNLILPNMLLNSQVEGARFEEGSLTIKFAREATREEAKKRGRV